MVMSSIDTDAGSSGREKRSRTRTSSGARAARSVGAGQLMSWSSGAVKAEICARSSKRQKGAGPAVSTQPIPSDSLSMSNVGARNASWSSSSPSVSNL